MGKIIFEDYPSTKTPINASNLNAMQDELINLIYPIGSIFMSANSTNPSSYLGGTWEQIKDRFLLGAGDTCEAGSVGGESTHTLTEEEMPEHEHEVVYANNGKFLQLGTVGSNYNITWASSGYDGNAEILAKKKGGSQPHNNMPPYLTVYMWQRVE